MSGADLSVRSSFTREAMVRSNHIYIWEVYIGEELLCQRDEENRHNPYVVAVLKSATVVGHLARKISTLCLLFIRRTTWETGFMFEIIEEIVTHLHLVFSTELV